MENKTPVQIINNIYIIKTTNKQSNESTKIAVKIIGKEKKGRGYLILCQHDKKIIKIPESKFRVSIIAY